MEARLRRALPGAGAAPTEEKRPAPAEDTSDAEAAVIEGAPNAWPDESAESSMLGELRERGEKPAVPAGAELSEETDPKALPPLSELVNRLPPEVRETLDDLFRARFVAVRRVPANALTK